MATTSLTGFGDRMSAEVCCFTCHRPIELGAVLGHGHLHCSFECAAETGRRLWKSPQALERDSTALPAGGSRIQPNEADRRRACT